MTKLLCLGGSLQQIEPMQRAREKGWKVILCDYLPDNPGQNYADAFYCVSTTDLEAVLKIARDEEVDGVLAYASDPAALTAAYVAQELQLSGHPYASVDILTDKGKFRDFLVRHDFATPRAGAFETTAQFLAQARDFTFPCIVKPVDSSGSKGVSKIKSVSEIDQAAELALQFSRAKRFIVEEYVEQSTYQVAGDGFSIDGKLVFRCFGNDHFNPEATNPFVPIAASFPSVLSPEKQNEIHAEIQRLFDILDMGTGAYNFDIRIGHDGKIYLMEIGPRNGGNYLPQLIHYATGVDMIELSLLAAVGHELPEVELLPARGFWTYYSLHSTVRGILKEIRFSDTFRKDNLVDVYLTCEAGQTVQAYTGSNTTLGIILCRFTDFESMIEAIEHPEHWLTIELED